MSHCAQIITHKICSPGIINIKLPLPPCHFSQVIYAAIHSNSTISDPIHSPVILSIRAGMTEIYSIASHFDTTMNASFCLTNIPYHEPPVLDYNGVLSYEVRITAQVPFQGSIRVKHW